MMIILQLFIYTTTKESFFLWGWNANESEEEANVELELDSNVWMTHPSENGDLFSSIERLVTADALVVAGDCVLVAACPTTF